MMHQKTVSRRTFLSLGGAIAGTGILAACAPGPPPQASGPDMTMAEPVTIRYGRHDPAAGVQTTLDAFHEEYSQIQVKVEQIGEFHAKIPALAAAGTLPDVVRSWEAMALDLGRNNQFIDVQPYVDVEPGFNPEDFYENWWNYPVVEGKTLWDPRCSCPPCDILQRGLVRRRGGRIPGQG